MLGLHACSSVQVGSDHVEQLVGAMFDQYVLLSKYSKTITREGLNVTPLNQGYEYSARYEHQEGNFGEHGFFKFTIELEYIKVDRGEEKITVP